jgi:flagellin-like hook-associated protein FlgL
LSRTQRNSLDAEADKLVEEFNRLVATTQFNSVGLLDGTTQNMRLQGGYGANGGISFGLVDKLSRTSASGSFRSGVTHTSSSGAQSDAVYADFDGDGVPDRVSVGVGGGPSGMWFFKGNGDGTFGAGTQNSIGVQFSSVASGDFDGDGDLDLIASGTSSMHLYINGGSGTFSGTSFPGIVSTNALSVGDFNGDGRADVAVLRSASAGINIYQGTAGGGLSLSQNIAGNYTASKAIDIDGDGDSDLVTVDSTGNVRSALNNGAGTLALGSILFSVGSSGSDIDISDVTDDGVLDIIVTEGFERSLYAGDGAQGYTSRGSLSSSLSFYSDTQLVDFNGDGNLDILSQNDFGASLSIQFGDGYGNFGSEILVETSSSNTEVLDLNGDGILDLVSIDSSGNTVSNFGNATNTASIGQLDLNTASDALGALSTIDGILNRINQQRGAFGAQQSRVQNALQVLHAMRDNDFAAAARISDVDVAMESAQLAKSQILQQVSSAILAQANQAPALALTLLSGTAASSGRR